LLPESSLQDIHNDAEALENWLLKNHNGIGVDLEHLVIGGASSGKWSRLWRADKSSYFYNDGTDLTQAHSLPYSHTQPGNPFARKRSSTNTAW
jgi:hypothetical protein